MESRLIYISSQRLSSKIEWLNTTRENGAWLYFGNGDEMKKDFVIKCIHEHFKGDTLYLAWTRTESVEVKNENIEKEIEHILGIDHFSIWDTDFTKTIEFNKIGVMRIGVRTG